MKRLLITGKVEIIHHVLVFGYRGHAPHASPGRMSATRMEEKRLTALLSRMGFPQILWVVADS